MGLRSDMIPDLGRRSLVLRLVRGRPGDLVVSMIVLNRQQGRDKPLLQLVPQLVLKVERDDTDAVLGEVGLVELQKTRETGGPC